MPGTLLHKGALVQCAHQGMAMPADVSLRVKVSGQQVAVLGGPWTVSACTQPPPMAGNGPCVTATFATSALRVKADTKPVLLMDSMATCVPTGTPLTVKTTQQRVKGT